MRKTIYYSLFIAIALVFAGCQTDNLQKEKQASNLPTIKSETSGKSVFGGTGTEGDGSGTAETASVACANNFTNDGCNFTSGSGLNYQYASTMATLMNACRTETPGGCAWDGYQTTTVTLNMDYNGCCESYSTMNSYLNNLKAQAQSSRPGSMARSDIGCM
jgi:hypothetical protein